ncbi:hypothetical protein EYF80_009568 [Liparis tanakae]|uniref:Uncharacterized protein n=1 Tax=Liparis tanakae TaxID=230148 RepID=A0A4Z2IST3_9TELE|nr:hypothetical protein EYF80_009568 [Liparis tanakae]
MTETADGGGVARCRLALFSSSSLTTSIWPSLAAEISAVQQSCTHRQPVSVGTPIILQIQFAKRLFQCSAARGTVEALYPPAGRTRCSWKWGVAWTDRSVRVKYERRLPPTIGCNASPFLFCVGARVSTGFGRKVPGSAPSCRWLRPLLPLVTEASHVAAQKGSGTPARASAVLPRLARGHKLAALLLAVVVCAVVVRLVVLQAVLLLFGLQASRLDGEGQYHQQAEEM